MEKVTGTALGLATAGHRENIIRGVGGRCSGRYSVVKCAVGNEIYSGSLNDDEMIEKIVDILLMKAKNDKKFQKKLSKRFKKL